MKQRRLRVNSTRSNREKSNTAIAILKKKDSTIISLHLKDTNNIFADCMLTIYHSETNVVKNMLYKMYSIIIKESFNLLHVYTREEKYVCIIHIYINFGAIFIYKSFNMLHL